MDTKTVGHRDPNSLIFRVSRILSSLAHPAQHFILTSSSFFSCTVTIAIKVSCAGWSYPWSMWFLAWATWTIEQYRETTSQGIQVGSVWDFISQKPWVIGDTGCWIIVTNLHDMVWLINVGQTMVSRTAKWFNLYRKKPWVSLSRLASAKLFISDARDAPPFCQAAWILSGTCSCLSAPEWIVILSISEPFWGIEKRDSTKISWLIFYTWVPENNISVVINTLVHRFNIDVYYDCLISF